MDAGKKCHGLNIYLSFTGLLVRPQTLTGGMYGRNDKGAAVVGIGTNTICWVFVDTGRD